MEQQEPSVPSIIYIAGYGRSGSTLLDRILSQHQDVLGSGEICNALTTLQTPDQLCSCGAAIGKCGVWKTISEHIRSWMNKSGLSSTHELGVIQRKMESRKSLVHLLISGKLPALTVDEQNLYNKYQGLLFSTFSRCQKGQKYVVDSSKTAAHTAARPVVLSLFSGLPVHVIHLVRDPRSVLRSRLKGGNHELEKGLATKGRLIGFRTILGWIQANLSAAAISLLIGRERVCLVRYEDLVDKPHETVEQICTFLGVESDSITEAFDREFLPQVSHMASGNRMRLKPTKLENKKSETTVPGYLRWLCTIMCFPLMKKYGYTRSGGVLRTVLGLVFPSVLSFDSVQTFFDLLFSRLLPLSLQ